MKHIFGGTDSIVVLTIDIAIAGNCWIRLRNYAFEWEAPGWGGAINSPRVEMSISKQLQ